MNDPRVHVSEDLTDEIIQAIEDSCDECGHFPGWDCEHSAEPLDFND